MRLKESSKIIIALAVIAMFFIVVISIENSEKSERHKIFKSTQIASVVIKTEFKGKFDKIIFNNGMVISYTIEPWEKGMAKYENKSLTDVIMSGDSIVKLKGEFKLNIYKKNGEHFELIGKGSVNKSKSEN